MNMKKIILISLVSIIFLFNFVSVNAPWCNMGGDDSLTVMDLPSGVNAENPSMQLQTNAAPESDYDTPKIAFEYGSAGDKEIYFKQWNGFNWVNADGLAQETEDSNVSKSPGFNSDEPSIALDDTGNPFIAWREDTGGQSDILLRKWNGSAWVSAGGTEGDTPDLNVSSLIGGEARQPSLAVHNNIPYIAWREFDGTNYYIALRKWNGTDAWVEMSAGKLNVSDTSPNEYFKNPSLKINSDGNPNVAWEENDGTGNWNIFFRKWNGSAWTEISTGKLNVSGTGDDYSPKLPSLDIHSDNPHIAWELVSAVLHSISFRKWSGTGWVSAAGFGQDYVIGPSMVEDLYNNPTLDVNATGVPYVVWNEKYSGVWSIVLEKWNGSLFQWVNIDGTTIPATHVVGQSNFADSSPVLVLDSNNVAIVAWDMMDGGQTNIACKRYWYTCGVGENEFPEVSITSPVGGGGNFNALMQKMINFDGTITNTPSFEDCNYSWDSNMQGNLCTGNDCKNPSCVTSLSPGTHEITLTATDSIGQPSFDTIIGFIEPYEGQYFAVTEFNVIKLNPPGFFAIDGNIRVDVNVTYFQLEDIDATLVIDLKDATTRKSINPFPQSREIKFIDEDVNEFSEIISFADIPGLEEKTYLLKVSIEPGEDEVTLWDNEVSEFIVIGPPIGTMSTTRAFLELPLYAIPIILGVILVLIYRKKIIPARFLPKRKGKQK